MQDFAHLHVHSEYSLLDGFSRVKRLVQQAKALGMRHLALTDHGAMYGIIEFHKAALAEGIHPVLGLEAYLADDIGDHSRQYDYTHLLLLAANDVGYRNLLQLTTIAHTRGMHYRPRIDKRVLAEHAQGLIATSACLSGEIPKQLLRGDLEGARATARWYLDTFGRENFYLEIQEHHGQDSEQGRLNLLLFDLHRETGIPLLLTNDLHYVLPEDGPSQDLMLCIQTGRQVSDPKRMRFDHESAYCLKSASDMALLFPDLPEAMTNSVRIAERCSVDPLARRARLPDFRIPPGYASQDAYLHALCLEGVKERYGEMSERVQAQLDYEIGLIAQKGFVPYFLIVGDTVRFARTRGIRCSARGSAAGSILAYTLGITNVDPLRWGLPFERFFNPERADMPDIDMDWPHARREEVIEYMAHTYGEECVAQMVTFNTMAAKASVKDVARVLGEQAVGDRITRLIPSGPKVTLRGSLEKVKELSTLYQGGGAARDIIDQAMKLEGSVRTTGVHAAGVIIANEPLERFVPLQLRDPKDAGKGRITQYEQAHLEELGLHKFDMLGLSNLTILEDTIRFIQQARGEEVVLERVPLDPTGDGVLNAKRAAAFALLARGETTGIFQLEGIRMTEYLKQLRPSRVEDIMAMIALYRPGPMDSIPEFIDAKHGRKKVTYLDPRLEQWLGESYGVITYQDHVLFICVNLAGFSWGKVNAFRKVLSKKKADEVVAYRDDFVEGCVHNGMVRAVAEQLFTLIMPFGGYGFNKAHAASYAVVAFYTAYLKANYTVEFMAATMTTESSDAKKIASAIAECRRMGVPVRGADVNASSSGFTVEDGGVRFGLLAIKGIGEGPIGEIVRAREAGGRFTSLGDFCARVDPGMVGKNVIETLIRAGAMDSVGDGKRHQLLASVDMAIGWGKSMHAAQRMGMESLFGPLEETENAFAFALRADAEELSPRQLLVWEKELLGVYVSGHPLGGLGDAISAWVTHTTQQLSEELVGREVTIGGMVDELRRITTKRGDTMCVARVEDLHGSIPVTVFPRMFEVSAGIWQEGAVVLVRGELKQGRDGLELECKHVEPFVLPAGQRNGQVYRVRLAVRADGHDDATARSRVEQLHALLQGERGPDRYEIVVDTTEWSAVLEGEGGRNALDFTPALQQQVTALLGQGSVAVRVMAGF